jgi:hypothetical protein
VATQAIVAADGASLTLTVAFALIPSVIFSFRFISLSSVNHVIRSSNLAQLKPSISCGHGDNLDTQSFSEPQTEMPKAAATADNS